MLTALILLLRATSYEQKSVSDFGFGATEHATYRLEKRTLGTPSIGPFSTPFDLKHFGMILLKKIERLSCRTKRCIGMGPSRKIANLLSKQISTLAIAREVYGYGTEPENREFAGQANQHSRCRTERCMGMIPSYFDTVACPPRHQRHSMRTSSKSRGYCTLMLIDAYLRSNKQQYSMRGGEKINSICMASAVHHLKKFIVGN